METLEEIIRNNRMSTRPEYYSGRGATMSDLNDEILEGIYKGIQKEFGKDAAFNYVKMIADIKVLSATTFLQELYDLFYNNWKYVKKKKHADGIAVQKNSDGNYDETHGMLSIFSAMSSGNRDDTQSIKGYFLKRHGVKSKELVDYSNGTVRWYY